MPKALSFKGDPKPKKRKRTAQGPDDDIGTTDGGGNASGTKGTAATARQSASNSARGDVEDDLSAWTTADRNPDLSGPTVLVFPPLRFGAAWHQALSGDGGHVKDGDENAEAQTAADGIVCLATDATGKTFPSRIENVVERNPASSEPHDVRQVWVSRIIDGEKGKVCFKGFHGRYLSADKFGILSATREAISSEETFVLEPLLAQSSSTTIPPNTSFTTTSTPRFRMRTCWGKYLGRDETSGLKSGPSASRTTVIRGDIEINSADEAEERTVSAPGAGAGGRDTRAIKTIIKQEEQRPSYPEGEDEKGSSEIILRIQQKYKTRDPTSKSAGMRMNQDSARISRQQIRADAGKNVRLEEEDVQMLRRAHREGTYHEALLDVRAKRSHDKFA